MRLLQSDSNRRSLLKKKIKCVFMCNCKSFTKRKFNNKLTKFDISKKLKNKKCDCEFKINEIYNKYLNT